MLIHELQEHLEVRSYHYQVELSILISARVLTVAMQTGNLHRLVLDEGLHC